MEKCKLRLRIIADGYFWVRDISIYFTELEMKILVEVFRKIVDYLLVCFASNLICLICPLFGQGNLFLLGPENAVIACSHVILPCPFGSSF